MKLPTKVKIGGRTWKVDLNPDEHDAGTVFWEQDRIGIRESLSGYNTRQVLLHEVLHVIQDELGHYQTKERIPPEVQMDGMAHQLIQVMDENVSLRKFVFY